MVKTRNTTFDKTVQRSARRLFQSICKIDPKSKTLIDDELFDAIDAQADRLFTKGGRYFLTNHPEYESNMDLYIESVKDIVETKLLDDDDDNIESRNEDLDTIQEKLKFVMEEHEAYHAFDRLPFLTRSIVSTMGEAFSHVQRAMAEVR